jgi:hypothetical protein
MIDKDKQYKTRGGLPYRCYATDGGGRFPVHGSFFKNNEWHPIQHKENGMFGDGEHHHDLIEVKLRMRFERWVEVERDGSYSLWLEKPSTASSVDAFAITRISFEVEEGEGLDAV